MKINIHEMAQHLLSEGFVIIEDIVSKIHLDILHSQMIGETWKMISDRNWGGVGALYGHLQQNPPRCTPYVFRDIVSNTNVMEISRLVLGDSFYNDFYSANTNCPGSIMQPVHSDCSSLWPGNMILHPPVSLIVNIPLIDVDERNGSIELWPRSHQVLGTQKFVENEMLDERRKNNPPIRANMRKGSVLIRDARTWHRGMPNVSDAPRHMIALMHHIHWHQRGEAIPFKKGCESEILDPRIDHHIYFTDAPIDYSIDPTMGAYSKIATNN